MRHRAGAIAFGALLIAAPAAAQVTERLAARCARLVHVVDGRVDYDGSVTGRTSRS